MMVYMAVQNDADPKILKKDLDQLCAWEDMKMMEFRLKSVKF